MATPPRYCSYDTVRGSYLRFLVGSDMIAGYRNRGKRVTDEMWCGCEGLIKGTWTVAADAANGAVRRWAGMAVSRCGRPVAAQDRPSDDDGTVA